MKKLLCLIAIGAAALLAGCASSGDLAYYKAIEARANAEAARYRAIAHIGSGAGASDVAKVASVMALQDRNGSGQPPIAAPRSFADTILQAASILAPTLVQAYGIRQNTQLGLAQSNNAARVTESTNNAFVGLASRIQAPAANVSTVTTTTTDARTTDNSTHSASDSSGSGNTSNTTRVGDYSGASSGNSGRIAGTSISDSTSTPTVVTQPAPVVVTQPAPLVVTQPAPVIVAPAAP